MNNQHLTDLLGIPDVTVSKYYRNEQGHLILEVQQCWEIALCPHCGKLSTDLHDYGDWRLVRDCPAFGQPCYLRVRSRRFDCPTGGQPFTEILSWVAPNGRYTRRYEAYVFALCKHNTCEDVARLEELSPEAVEGIFTRQGQAQVNFSPSPPAQGYRVG